MYQRQSGEASEAMASAVFRFIMKGSTVLLANYRRSKRSLMHSFIFVNHVNAKMIL